MASDRLGYVGRSGKREMSSDQAYLLAGITPVINGARFGTDGMLYTYQRDEAAPPCGKNSKRVSWFFCRRQSAGEQR